MRAWQAATLAAKARRRLRPAHCASGVPAAPSSSGSSKASACKFATTLEENLDLLLGRLQGALAVAGEGDAALEEFQGLIQRQVPALESLGEGFQLGQSLFEVRDFAVAGQGHGILFAGRGQGRATLHSTLHEGQRAVDVPYTAAYIRWLELLDPV